MVRLWMRYLFSVYAVRAEYMLDEPTRLGKTDERIKYEGPEEHVGLQKEEGWTKHVRQRFENHSANLIDERFSVCCGFNATIERRSLPSASLSYFMRRCNVRIKVNSSAALLMIRPRSKLCHSCKHTMAIIQYESQTISNSGTNDVEQEEPTMRVLRRFLYTPSQYLLRLPLGESSLHHQHTN
jgi:hypothetical protein